MTYNIITYDVEIILLRNNAILDRNLKPLPYKSKIQSNIYKKLISFSKEQLKNPENIYMHLFYTGGEDFKGLSMEILRKLSLHEINDKIIFKTKVRYILPKPISTKKLRANVDDIFRHWSRSGDVQYGLKKFKVISKINNHYWLKTNGKPIYHNLLQ